MNRRAFLRVFALPGVALAAGQFAGCDLGARLRVGIHPWIGYESIRLAAGFGWLPNGVELLVGENATDSLTALEQDAADAACLTLDEVLRARDAGLPLSVALVMNVSAGADALLARPGLTDLQQLAGARLGYETSALGALVLEEVLIRADLSAEDLILLNLPPDNHLAAWQAGEVDALISYEPTVSRLEQAGMQRLFDSRDMPDTIFDVLAVRQSLSGSEQGLLRQLIQAHFRGLRHLRINPQDAMYRIAALQAMEPEFVRQALAGVILPGLAANRGYLSGQDTVLAKSAVRLSRKLVATGLTAQVDTLERLLAPNWLPLTEEPG